MDCPHCGAETRPGQKFCSECGTPLAAVCPSCGSPVDPGSRFCGECGTALAGSVPSGPSVVAEAGAAAVPEGNGRAGAPPQAERRLVSVLFADLVDFTALAESLDAEAVRDVQSGYFETAREIVARYGGTIEKFIGDAVMAVWGAPTAHEDDAERAVRAALDLVEAVKGIGVPADGRDLQARAGVLTGEAVVTVGAEGQGMVSGDLVNTASRLQAVAPPGVVLVGQTTRDSASVAVSFETVGEQALKGKSLPVPAWRAVRVVAGRGGAGRYWGLEPPFEGRDDELRLLKDLFNATARERRARLVTVLGQAGTGKSRLTREFEKYTDGLVEDVFWHIGRSPSYGEGITFWALGEMVRKRAGLAEIDDAATTRERIAATLVEYVPDEAERRWIEPRLLQLLGLEEGRGGEREEVFAAWRTFFERVADKGPTVMAFEDLEFADPGMLDFIDHVLEWSRAHPIFIIALARPELLERRPGWGAGHRNFVAIGLEPLSDDAMREMLAGLVPGLPEPAVKAILSRAEGVPLYAVETVRMLLNTGRLVAQEGIYQPAGDLAELEVPNTLHALIAARLDALEASDRSVLQDAAILGQTFTMAALAAVSAESPDTLEPRLRALVRREVLVLDIDPRSPERGQYGFVQGLVREVAYGTLSKRDRRSRHLAAARYLESLGDEEIVGALAMHYLDAWKAAPEGPEGEAVAAQARVALRAAADRAAKLHSPGQALAYLEHLLPVVAEEAERAAVLERAASAAEAMARFDVAERYGYQAIEAYRALGDRSGVARATSALGLAMSMSAKLAEGLDLVQRTWDELRDMTDDPGVVEMAAQLARFHALRNENERALELADQALVAAERLDLVEVIGGAVMTKGVALRHLRRNRESLLVLPGVLLLAESHGLVQLELRARLNLSQAEVIDEPKHAGEVARVGLERARKLGLRDWETLLAGNALMAALFTGEWDWATAAAAEVVRDEPLQQATTEVAGYPAVTRALRGDPSPLDEMLGTFEQLLSASTDPQYVAIFNVLRAWSALAHGDLAETFTLGMVPNEDPTYASFAHTLAGHAALWSRDADGAGRARDALRDVVVRGRWIDACRRSLDAGVAALEGREREAVTGFGEAARQWREMELPLDLGLCLMDQVATLGPAAGAAADEAREVLTKLGAAALLERLDALLAAPPIARAAKGRAAKAGPSTAAAATAERSTVTR